MVISTLYLPGATADVPHQHAPTKSDIRWSEESNRRVATSSRFSDTSLDPSSEPTSQQSQQNRRHTMTQPSTTTRYTTRDGRQTTCSTMIYRVRDEEAAGSNPPGKHSPGRSTPLPQLGRVASLAQ